MLIDWSITNTRSTCLPGARSLTKLSSLVGQAAAWRQNKNMNNQGIKHVHVIVASWVMAAVHKVVHSRVVQFIFSYQGYVLVVKRVSESGSLFTLRESTLLRSVHVAAFRDIHHRLCVPNDFRRPEAP